MGNPERRSFRHLDLPESIVPRLRARENAAFRELFDTAFDQLVHFAYSIVESRETAKDIVQDVFVKIMEQGADFNPRGSLAGYLFRAVRNASLNVVRDRQIDERATARMVNASIIDAAEEYHPGSFSNIEEYLSALSERQRTVVHLRFMEQLSIAETADILGISTRATISLLNRAINAIREGYKG